MKLQVRLYRAASDERPRDAAATLTLTDRRDDARLIPTDLGLSPSARFFLQSVEAEDADLTDSIVAALRRNSIRVSRATSSRSGGVRTRGDGYANEPYGTGAYWRAAVGRLETHLPLELDPSDWTRMVTAIEDLEGEAVPDDEANILIPRSSGGHEFPRVPNRSSSAASPVAGTSPPPVAADWLARLDPDPVRADQTYRILLRDLTRFLEWREHDDPEAAAQEAIVRGLARIGAGADTSKAGVRAYLFGFAKNLVKEGWKVRTRERPLDEAIADRSPAASRHHEQVEAKLTLQEVLGRLPADERRIIVRYCTEDDHSALCRELGVTANYLRVIVHRIRTGLRETRASSRTAETK